jgi:hypothetical protein
MGHCRKGTACYFKGCHSVMRDIGTTNDLREITITFDIDTHLLFQIYHQGGR